MPYEIPLPRRLKNQGWKVKIREKERLEPPHVTVMCRARERRINLRSGDFLVPPGGAWDDIDEDVQELIRKHWDALKAAWDAKYPSNPISSQEEGEDDE